MFVEVATATAGGTPIKINAGVRINPPPMPNIPAKIPDMPPSITSQIILAESSARGK